MRDTMDKCTTSASPPVTAQTIIHDFVFKADMAYFEENLHELFVSFFANEDDLSAELKNSVVHTYMCLRELIKNVQIIETKIRPQ
jgi:hypothetical protein